MTQSPKENYSADSSSNLHTADVAADASSEAVFTGSNRRLVSLPVSDAQKAFLLKEQFYKRKVTILRTMLLILFLSLWELGAETGAVNDFIFSSPLRIVRCFLSMTGGGAIFYHIGITLFETLISFVLVVFFGLFCALLLWSSKSISDVAEPYLVALNSLPKSALAPLLIVWLGNNMKTIIVAAVSVAVFGSIMTLFTSFRQTDPEQIKLIYSLGGTKRDVLLKVLLPSSVPLIISNMKVNIGLCLVGVIIGEFLAANAGLGYLIIYGQQTFKMDQVVMSIVILCIVSAVLYQGISWLEKRLL